jgi:hypothetical protein
MMRHLLCGWLGVACGLCYALPGAAETLKLPLTLTVEAGNRERVDAPVNFPLPKENADEPPLRLIETTGGKETPVAVQRDEVEGKLWWIADGTTAAGAKRIYRLESVRREDAASQPKFPSVALSWSDGAMKMTFDSKPLLQYAQAHVAPAEGINPKYGRSGHLHPVWTPGGAIVTDELPPDHLHQSGIFLAYTKTEFKGREVDFWNLAGGKGRVRYSGFGDMISGSVFGQLSVRHEHVDLTQADASVGLGAKTGGDVALNEIWHVRAWPAGLPNGYWLLDIHSLIRCAGKEPLKLPEYHYGGMAIRAAREWTPQQVQFLTSQGVDREKGNHLRPRWCRISGAVAGKQAGITLMTHPANFRFPEPLRIHPTMPYMVYTPSYLGAWEIAPSLVHESRYRFIVHDGELPVETIERLWQDFAEPLTAVGG